MTISHKSRWEKIDHSTAFTSQGEIWIATFRLSVPGGWLYKVTEGDEKHHTIQLCFVPEEIL
jgi:hypothetical protein